MADKKKWSVSGAVTGSIYLGEYEADSAEEAIKMALDDEEAHPHMCHQCARYCEDPMIDEETLEAYAESQ